MFIFCTVLPVTFFKNLKKMHRCPDLLSVANGMTQEEEDYMFLANSDTSVLIVSMSPVL